MAAGCRGLNRVSQTPARIQKDMGITHAEFRRILPVLFDEEAQLERLENGVRAAWPGRYLVLTLGPERQRRIAQLSLPSTLITIEFFDFSESQRAAFLAHFDRRFQRGGG